MSQQQQMVPSMNNFFGTEGVEPLDYEFEKFSDLLPLPPLADSLEFIVDGRAEELAEDDSVHKKLKTAPSSPPVPVPVPVPAASNAVPATSNNGAAISESNQSGYFFFFDIINHLLSYDQILDLICQNICTQLVFNRRFFRNSGLDSQTLLQSIMQKSVGAVDFSEYPGSMVQSFLLWSYEKFGLEKKPLPPIYCMVCGRPDGHDEGVHLKFFESLDQPFVLSLQQKAKNLYELVKELISFLLKFPNSRAAFQSFIQENLHCPFCSEKHGQHSTAVHQEWTATFRIDAPPVEGMYSLHINSIVLRHHGEC